MEGTHRRTVQKKILITKMTTKVWSLTQNQTFWNVKSNEALLSLKLMEAMEFQESYLRS